ncbi:hypothetical protein [Streptomyces sp. NPDC046821]|uniref:hypothetical protein n=1 Tax=Streptomyces sp. NPDC046821 TaxID=3154702 RepID=UPI0033F02CF5
MEQRIDTKKVTPVDAAGADPASVPGFAPVGKGATAAVPEQADAEREPDAEPEASVESAESSVALTKEAESLTKEAESPSEPEDSADAPGDNPEDDDEGPAFSASDRRGSITADKTGVVLQLDDQEAEFRWDEIGAVEVGTSRRRLTVTVHTPDSRWYPNDVEAPDKARAQEWADELDKVLDAYFED